MKRRYLVDVKLSAILFVVMFAFYSLIYMTKNCYNAAMAAIVAEGIMTKSQTGLINAAFFLVYAPLQIVGGIAADRYSPHKLIAIGTFGAGIANLLIYFTQNYVAMIIIWSLNAAVQFGVWPAVFKIISTELTPKHCVTAVFYINLSGIIGLLLSYVFAIFISDWKNHFLMSAIVLFCVTAIFHLSYTGIKKNMVTEEVSTLRASEKENEKNKKGELFGLLIKSGLPFLFIVYMIHGMLNIGIKTVVPVMMMESYEGVSPSLANALNIILILMGASGIFAASIKIFRWFSEPAVIFAIFLITVPLLLLITYVGRINIAVIVVVMAVVMLLFAAASTLFGQISRVFAAYGFGATVSGIFNCMASVGVVISNYLFTRLADDYGWEITAKVWFFFAIFATALSMTAIPIWRNFVRKTK